MTGPRTVYAKKDEVSADEEEKLSIPPEDVRFIRALVATYLHRTPEEQARRYQPRIYHGAMHALGMLAHAEGQEMFRSTLLLDLQERLRLRGPDLRAVMERVDYILERVDEMSPTKKREALSAGRTKTSYMSHPRGTDTL